MNNSFRLKNSFCYLAAIVFLFLACKEKTKERVSIELESNQNKISKSDSLEIQWIKKKIDSTIRVNNIPALAVGIIKNGKLVYKEGFGHLNRESSIKVDEHTLFQIGSDTKKFTGIIVNNLVSEGKLNLEEPMTTYLKEDLSGESIKKLSTITIKTLLQHKSGIPNREPSNRRIDGDPMLVEFSEKDLIKDLNVLKLDFEPNSKFSYSNFGYAIVGYICEKVSGRDYSTLVKTYISDKYDMPNTVVYPNETLMTATYIDFQRNCHKRG